MAWQMMTSLAYGAKGLLWFCYGTPTGQGIVFDRGGAALSPTGHDGCIHGNCSLGPIQPSFSWYAKTEHFTQGGRLNGIVRNLGDFLLEAESTGVWRVHAMPVPPVLPHAVNRLQPSVNLSDQGGCAIVAITDAAAGRANDAYGLRVSRFILGEGVLIGQFKLKDGRTAVLVHNHSES